MSQYVNIGNLNLDDSADKKDEIINKMKQIPGVVLKLRNADGEYIIQYREE